MEPQWSTWILYAWIAFGAAGFALELVGLHNDADSLPPLTTILVNTVKKHWWVGIPVLGFPVWLVIHFGRRIF